MDFAICAGLTYLAFGTVGLRALARPRRGTVLVVLLLALLPAIYAVGRDAFGGKSVGKILFGLTTVRPRTLARVGLADSILRNIVFGFIAVPGAGWLIYLGLSGFAAGQILAGKPNRVGESLGNTLVVDDRDLERRTA